MTDSSVSRFWDNFISKTNTYTKKPSTSRWLVKHAEAYIKHYSNQKLTTHNAEYVECYLTDKGRQKGLKDWQFAQIVLALEILFAQMVKPDWAYDFPWQDGLICLFHYLLTMRPLQEKTLSLFNLSYLSLPLAHLVKHY